jgi:hypothetical protein
MGLPAGRKATVSISVSLVTGSRKQHSMQIRLQIAKPPSFLERFGMGQIKEKRKLARG